MPAIFITNNVLYHFEVSTQYMVTKFRVRYAHLYAELNKLRLSQVLDFRFP